MKADEARERGLGAARASILWLPAGCAFWALLAWGLIRAFR